MATPPLPEVWLRGPLPGIDPLLQPVAHALLQAREEITGFMNTFPDGLLWEKPAGLASPGFHLQHLSGVLDRLFTYARGESLSGEQFAYLKAEGMPAPGITAGVLLERFRQQVDRSLKQLEETGAGRLTEARAVGRAALPSTVLGLLVHAAEHTMRHCGQLMVTARILEAKGWESRS